MDLTDKEGYRISTDNFDKVFEIVGGFGKFQIVSFVLLFISSYIYGYLSIAGVFLAPKVDHWCRDDSLAHFSPEIQRCVGVPRESNTYSHCSRFVVPQNVTFRDDVSSCDVTNRTLYIGNWSTAACDEWVYDRETFPETAVTEVCTVSLQQHTWNVVLKSPSFMTHA